MFGWIRHLTLVFLVTFCCGCVSRPPVTGAFRTAQTLDGRQLPPFRIYWTAFQNPSRFNAEGLYLLQPYQRGRIPLVLIHGLASDAYTWDCVIEQICACADVRDRFQIWVYQYPTGYSFLRSAANLRQELLLARETLDPQHSDAAFDQAVLVGHSMGGLLAKLQASYSDDCVWRSISDVPLDDAITGAPLPESTVSAVLFRPVPFVNRVVYIATPHLGSNWTRQPLGRIGRWLINVPDQVQREYQRLLRSNPGLFRNPAPLPPSSLDHLTPGNSVIRATNSLRYKEGLHTHSIIGTGYVSPDGFWGDGVVALPSARRPDVDTECILEATHSGILRNPQATAELIAVLIQAMQVTHSPVGDAINQKDLIARIDLNDDEESVSQVLSAAGSSAAFRVPSVSVLTTADSSTAD